MKISDAERVSVAPDVLFRAVADEAVLVNLETEQYLGLNTVGARMWSVLSSARSLQAAYDELLEEYDVDAAQLRADVEEFVGRLLAQQLIVISPASGETA